MIKTIAHLADIHIRKLHRFVEYRQVFKQLYKQLKEVKPDLIYIGGDIVHGKLDTSPEEVRMVANSFLSLCKIAPTIVIPGNPDCNLNNKSREDTLDNSDYPVKAGNHIEDRGSMVNFSMVGRNCTISERRDYFEYDKKTKERQKIADIIKSSNKDIDAVIGGQISIDIAPKGRNKSQVLKHIIEKESDSSEFIFLGDRIEEGGNDYPLAQLLSHKDKPYGYAYKVDGWEHTKRMLENIID